MDGKDPQDYERIINDCHLHIEAYLAGNPGHVEVVTTSTLISQHDGWAMFKPHGSLSRMGIVADGHYAFVLVRERPEGGCWTYTVQRTSDGVDFPLQRIFAALNEAEGGDERWGGGDTVDGSPRTAGSYLSPPEVAEAINKVLAKEPDLPTDRRRGGDRRTT